MEPGEIVDIMERSSMEARIIADGGLRAARQFHTSTEVR